MRQIRIPAVSAHRDALPLAQLFRYKLRAFCVHLGISFMLLLLPVVYLILVHWYPPPLFHTDGGWQGLRIMVLVDLVLGPSLTLLLFNPRKSGRALGIDFAVIAALQLTALLYGAHMVQSVRPWALAWSEGAFYVSTRETYVDQEIDDRDWRRLGARAPYAVYVREPADDDEAAGVATYGALAGIGAEGLFFLYEPLAPHAAAVRDAALDMTVVLDAMPELRDAHRRLTRRHAGQPLYFMPLHGFYESVIVATDGQGRIVGTLYHEPPAVEETASP